MQRSIEPMGSEAVLECFLRDLDLAAGPSFPWGSDLGHLMLRASRLGDNLQAVLDSEDTKYRLVEFFGPLSPSSMRVVAAVLQQRDAARLVGGRAVASAGALSQMTTMPRGGYPQTLGGGVVSASPGTQQRSAWMMRGLPDDGDAALLSMRLGTHGASSASPAMWPGVMSMSPAGPEGAGHDGLATGTQESGKSSRSGMRFLCCIDGVEWETADYEGLGKRIAKYQHLLRILSPERKEDFLGSGLRFDREVACRVMAARRYDMTLGVRVAPAYESLRAAGTAEGLVVFKDIAKQERMWLFEMDPVRPYLLSIADFLPSNSRLAYDSLDSEPGNKDLLLKAIENYGLYMWVVFGEDCRNAGVALREMLQDSTRMQFSCDAFVFNQVNRAIADLNHSYRVKKAAPDMPYRGPGQYSRHLSAALNGLVDTIPSGFLSAYGNAYFKEQLYRTIKWHAPKSNKGPGSKHLRNSGKEGASSSDEESETGSKKKKRKSPKKKQAQGPSAGSNVGGEGAFLKTPLHHQKRDGDSQGSDDEPRGRAGCVFHLLSMLKTALPTAEGLPDGCRYGSDCSRGHQIKSLNEVSREELAQAVSDAKINKTLKDGVLAVIKSAPGDLFKSG
jgi:hypothetical protein